MSRNLKGICTKEYNSTFRYKMLVFKDISLQYISLKWYLLLMGNVLYMYPKFGYMLLDTFWLLTLNRNSSLSWPYLDLSLLHENLSGYWATAQCFHMKSPERKAYPASSPDWFFLCTDVEPCKTETKWINKLKNQKQTTNPPKKPKPNNV